MNKISILIPVYNTGENFKKCLDSVINQTYNNLEIIIVDDGSDDVTKKICDYYETIDKRIKVFHIDNSGVANARNFALNQATADYVTFIDSDDFVDSDYIQVLFEVLNNTNSDISSCDLSYVNNYFVSKNNGYSLVLELDNKKSMEALMYGKLISNGPTCKLFKKELFDDILFPAKMNFEDLATIYKIVAKSKKCACILDKKYYYYQSKNSITHLKFNDKYLFLGLCADNIKKFMDEYYPELEKSTNYMYFSRYIDLSIKIPIFNTNYRKERKKIKKIFKKYRKSILNNPDVNNSSRLLAISSFWGIFGVKFGKVLLMSFDWITKIKGDNENEI